LQEIKCWGRGSEQNVQQLKINFTCFSCNLMIALFVFFLSLQTTTLSGKAVKIIDGDTFDLLSNGTMYRVRLNSIDCPERGQAYYKEAKAALGNFCNNCTVTVSYRSKDRNGRLLGDVYVNHQSINLLLVQQGYAWHFKKYSADVRLARAEIEARSAKRGLWADADAIAPWIWRRK
jgi:micrococcal nuclease